jgi:hypothetical protein
MDATSEGGPHGWSCDTNKHGACLMAWEGEDEVTEVAGSEGQLDVLRPSRTDVLTRCECSP